MIRLLRRILAVPFFAYSGLLLVTAVIEPSLEGGVAALLFAIPAVLLYPWRRPRQSAEGDDDDT
jgi:hypothetical protein